MCVFSSVLLLVFATRHLQVVHMHEGNKYLLQIANFLTINNSMSHVCATSFSSCSTGMYYVVWVYIITLGSIMESVVAFSE
jgi:hypothetical protein